MQLAYTETYNPIYHGQTDVDLNGKYISIFVPFTLDEFYNVDKDQFILTHNDRIIKLELVLHYNIGDLTLSSIVTNRLIVFQRKWKQYYYNRLRFIKNPKNILFRELRGRFPRVRY